MDTKDNPTSGSLVLVTGATGYIGGRLAKRLASEGFAIRCMARTPERLEGRFCSGVEVVRGDVLEPESLSKALAGVDTAYFLVHALALPGDFEAAEARGARNFAAAALEKGVRRIIYLGGLTGSQPKSAHMRSRHAVGEILRESGVQTLEFRASVVLGAGSLSFELVRTLVQRLPVMIVPKWVRVKAQPIAIDDVLAYLTLGIGLELPGDTSRVYEIGGAEQVSYLDLMKAYASERGVRRVFIPVPVLTPWLSSLWLNLVTPLFARVGRKLIDSICSASIVTNDDAARDFPVQPMSVQEAIRRAMAEEDRQFVETRWSDALSSSDVQPRWGGCRFGSRIVDSRVVVVEADIKDAFAVIERIGGKTGWYYGNWLWKLRGWMDRAIGGVGHQRGRSDPHNLRPGDTVDWWRVEAIERPNRLLLRAEMKLPGRAWLQFELNNTSEGLRIRQTAVYDPVGLTGLVYWYALYPAHEFIFSGMLRSIAVRAGGRTDALRVSRDPDAPETDLPSP
jgi:uncharacterized protein YbjT (DUF2867 family)